MKLLTYQTSDGLKLGVKTERGILDVQVASETLGIDELPVTPQAFIQAGLSALSPLGELVNQALHHNDSATWFRDEAILTYGACVPSPGKIICVGLNYRRHAAETGAQPPATPILFSKFNNALAAANEAVLLPSNAVKYDYEAELGVVIGKQCRYVSEDKALEYVLGYFTANDISARDLQTQTSQWLLGKTLDKFLPIGPYLVTSDEAGDPQNMAIRCWLNGELRQNSNTADMIFSVAQVVSYLSQYMTLESGDIISTGTPEGVILGMKNQVWMKPGDDVVVEVGELGRLTNRMVEG